MPRYGLRAAFAGFGSWRRVGNSAACVTAPHSSEVTFTTSEMVLRLVQSQTWKPLRYPNKRKRLIMKRDQIWRFRPEYEVDSLKSRTGTKCIPPRPYYLVIRLGSRTWISCQTIAGRMKALGRYSKQVIIQIDSVVLLRRWITLIAAHPRDCSSMRIVRHPPDRNWARDERWGRSSTRDWNGIRNIVPNRARETFQGS